ncbi:MAG: glycosyltransferase family 39 protein [Deltaproteobacteria bacterium]|nr:glycosyltransferase family 39 protein [Deltaproteobacteria bacterium]
MSVGLLLLAVSVAISWGGLGLKPPPRATVPLGGDVAPYTFALLVLLPAGLLVLAAGLNQSVRRTAHHLRRHPRDAIVVCAGLGVLALSLVPSGAQGRSMILYLAYASTGLTLVLIGVWPALLRSTAVPIERGLDGLHQLRPGVFLAAVFLLVFIPANLASYFLFEHIPHVQDSISQVFQAILFAHGRVSLQPPPHPEFFEQTFVLSNPRWYSMYPPGHAAVLALGAWLGTPWLINPVLGGLTAIAIYCAGKEIYGETTGRLAAGLVAVSPFVIFMSAEFMNHSSSLLFMSLFLLGFARTVRTQAPRSALLAGLALGAATCVRPLSGLALALPFILYALWLAVRAPRRFLPPFVLVAAAGCLPLAGFLLYNYAATGSMFTTGYASAGHGLGFGRSGWGPSHAPARAVVHALLEVNALHKLLFEWPIPSLVFLCALFVGRRRQAWDWLLLASWATLMVAYFFYWFQHVCLGPRYEFEAVAALVLLAARGLQSVPELLRDRLGVAASPQRVRQALALIVGLCVLTMLSVNLLPLVWLYGDSYWMVNAAVYRTVRQQQLDDALVFVNSNYSATFLGNFESGLELKGPVIYARNLAGAGPALMPMFANRRYYLADGPRLTEVHHADELLAAQMRKWPGDWQSEDCGAERGAGLVRAYGGKRSVLRTYSAAGAAPCRLTRTVTVERGRPAALLLSVTAAEQPPGDWQLRVFVDDDLIAQHTVSLSGGTRWQQWRHDLAPYAGRRVTLRLEHQPLGEPLAPGYWAAAQVLSGTMGTLAGTDNGPSGPETEEP